MFPHVRIKIILSQLLKSSVSIQFKGFGIVLCTLLVHGTTTEMSSSSRVVESDSFKLAHLQKADSVCSVSLTDDDVGKHENGFSWIKFLCLQYSYSNVAGSSSVITVVIKASIEVNKKTRRFLSLHFDVTR